MGFGFKLLNFGIFFNYLATAWLFAHGWIKLSGVSHKKKNTKSQQKSSLRVKVLKFCNKVAGSSSGGVVQPESQVTTTSPRLVWKSLSPNLSREFYNLVPRVVRRGQNEWLLSFSFMVSWARWTWIVNIHGLSKVNVAHAGAWWYDRWQVDVRLSERYGFDLRLGLWNHFRE